MLESIYIGNNNVLAYDRSLDLRFYLDAFDMRITPDILFKTHEPLWTKLFVDALRHGDTVLDVGANIGYYTLIAARKGCKKVFAFEPNPRSVELLRMSVEANRFADIVTIHRIAVGAKDEDEVAFWSDLEFPVGSHVKDEGVPHPERNKGEYIKVKRSSIDNVIGDLPVNLIKVDVEGSEDAVWEGMSRTVQMNAPKIKVLIELHKFSASSSKLVDKITEKGFHITTHTDELYGNQALLCEFI